MEERPDTSPSDPATLDRYERLIEATRLAGREEEAFELYQFALGGHDHLAWVLGDFERGYRVLAAFSATGRPEDLGPALLPRSRSIVANDLSLFAESLGRLVEARAVRHLADGWLATLSHPYEALIELSNSSLLAFAHGRLTEALMSARDAMGEAEKASSGEGKELALARRARAAHALGDIAAARADFANAAALESESPYSPLVAGYAAHELDLGHSEAARELVPRQS